MADRQGEQQNKSQILSPLLPENNNITNSFFESQIEPNPSAQRISTRISTRARSKSRKALPQNKDPEPEPAQNQSIFDMFMVNIVDPLMSIIEGQPDMPKRSTATQKEASKVPLELEEQLGRQSSNKSKIFDDDDDLKQRQQEIRRIKERSILLEADPSPNQHRASNSTWVHSQRFQGTAIRADAFIPKAAQTPSLNQMHRQNSLISLGPPQPFQQPRKPMPPPPPYALVNNTSQTPAFFGERPPPPPLVMMRGSQRQTNPSEHQTYNSHLTFK
jgi:hypothetical protein